MNGTQEALKFALETLQGIANTNWRNWQELASPEEFVRWAQARARHAILQSQEAQPCSLADVLAKLDEAKGCFDAAEVEGLSNILALQCGEEFFKLKDLVERRLMFAVDAIEEARSILSTAHGSERDKALEETARHFESKEFDQTKTAFISSEIRALKSRTPQQSADERGIELDEDEATQLASFISIDKRPITLTVCDGRAGYGLYAFDTEYPDEPAEFIAKLEQQKPQESGK